MQELLGVTPTKISIFDLQTGHLQRSWPYNTMIDWNINWEVKKLEINFNEEKIEFECKNADVKIIHEFIGGYIYMSMRANMGTDVDYEMLLKLTGGWDEQYEEEMARQLEINGH